MSSAQIDTDSRGVLCVTGELNYTSVLAVRARGEQLIAGASEAVQVDFSGVRASGSVAVSLMMCWLRAAAKAGNEIEFIGVPELLSRIIAVSGLEGHLPVQQA